MKASSQCRVQSERDLRVSRWDLRFFSRSFWVTCLEHDVKQIRVFQLPGAHRGAYRRTDRRGTGDIKF